LGYYCGMEKQRKSKVIFWSVGIIIVAAAIAGVCITYPVATWRGMWDGLSGKPVIPAGWVNYRNSDYGFSLWYPADWQVNTSQLQNDVPAVLFGNPIDGTTTYTLRVSVAQNDSGFTSAEYVADMLAQIKAQDEANGTNTPQLSVQFMSSTAFATEDYHNGYELNNVFEFDHNAERIYVTHDDEAFIFDFPIADANPNIASPTENNAIAHQIVKTLTFMKQVGSVSGGTVGNLNHSGVSVQIVTSSAPAD
jgi:hypothetical protein